MRNTKFWTTLSRQCLSSSDRPLCNAFRIRLSCTSPFSSSGVSCSSEGQQYPPNSSIIPNFVNNRNPRNLEKLRIGEKPDGYRLEKLGRSYWNKVTLDISKQHISASVVHYQGQKPVSVSTKEWCIKKYLYSTNDASASKIVGEVLAQRCLQTGITEIGCFFTDEERKKEKIQLFLKAIEDGGVALTEPTQAVVRRDWYIHSWNLPETPWDVHEGVDDVTSIARKLRGFTIRNTRFPSARQMLRRDKDERETT